MNRRLILLWEIIVLSLICLFLSFGAELGLSAADTNASSLLALVAALAAGAWAAASREPANLWTPLFSFRATVALYFGLGGLIPFFSDASTQATARETYAFSDAEALKVSLVVSVGVLALYAATYAIQELFVRALSTSKKADRVSAVPLTLGYVFLTIGIAIKVLFVLPNAFGLSQIAVPNLIGQLRDASLVGIFLIVVAAEKDKKLWTIVILATLFDSLSGLVLFNKTSVMLPILMVVLGILWRGLSSRRIILSACLLAGIYAAVEEPVTQARAEFSGITGSLNAGASLDARVYHLTAWADPRRRVATFSETDWSLLRLSYVNIGSWALAQFDAGRPGNPYDGAIGSFVPRYIWDDKPNYSAIGSQVAESYTGIVGENSVGMGLFAEAYWAGGWSGVWLVFFGLGILFALLSHFAVGWLLAGQWIYLPAIFIAMRMGFRSDGSLVVDVLGMLATVLVYVAAVHILRRVTV